MDNNVYIQIVLNETDDPYWSARYSREIVIVITSIINVNHCTWQRNSERNELETDNEFWTAYDMEKLAQSGMALVVEISKDELGRKKTFC